MNFNEWRIGAEKEISEVAKLMNQELSDNPTVLEQQIRNIEGHNYRLCSLTARAEYYLYIKRFECLQAKTKELSELDRETSLDNATKEQTVILNMLEYLCGNGRKEGIVSKRISTGQSFLKIYTATKSSLGGM